MTDLNQAFENVRIRELEQENQTLRETIKLLEQEIQNLKNKGEIIL